MYFFAFFLIRQKPSSTNRSLIKAKNITNKDDLTKENARIKQVLRENGYQESLRESLTITACFSHNNKRKPRISKRSISE